MSSGKRIEIGRRRGHRKVLKKFRFINNTRIIVESGLDRIKGQGALVLSILRSLPMPTDVQEVGKHLLTHPEFAKVKGNMTYDSAGTEPVERIVNYYKHIFKKYGLIENVDEPKRETETKN